MLALFLPLSCGAWAGLAGTAAAQPVVSAIVTNPLTGIAMDGYDPVSYFTETEPLPGSADFEYDWGGVPWYFASAANRDVFIGAPEIYCPQYGGHGAMAAARGFLSDGDPHLYAVFKQRLYLFYSPANREAFLLAPDQAAADGAKNWEKLFPMLTTQ